MKIAIVLSMDLTGLGVTRSLGRQGIDVYGIDQESDAIAFFSKYCKKAFVFPSPIAHSEECLDKFIELGRNLDDKAVLLPTSDYYVSFVSRFRHELSDYYLFNIPESSILETLVDKSKQYELAEKMGIIIPKTFSPQSIDELLEKEKSMSYPLFIKGTNADLWKSEFHAKGFIASSSDDLKGYFELALSKGIEVVIQEVIIGPNKNHFKVCAYYSKEKNLMAMFSTQKTRQVPIDFGTGSFMTSVNSPELIALGRRFFEGTEYTGVGSIEFKLDDRDHKFRMIELNPRFWAQNIQATYAGVNFPYINYLDCAGEKVVPSLDFKENICWLNAFEDLMSFIGNRKRGDVSLFQWLKSIFGTDCFAYVSRDDLRPAWKYWVSILKFLLNKPFANS